MVSPICRVPVLFLFRLNGNAFLCAGMNSSLESIKNNRTSLYWACQLIGWGTVSLYWAYKVYTRDDYGFFYTFLNYVSDAGIGILLTHIYRSIALKANWNSFSIQRLLIRVIPAVLVLAVFYALINNIKWYFFYTALVDDRVTLFKAIMSWDPIIITGLRLMSAWILAYHLYHYYQKEVATAQKNAQLSVLIKQTQLDNLSAQLNPHFLFNSLNSIKSLIKENPTIARRAIDLLSDLLRSSLYGKDQDVISIKDELALVQDYIALEKLRFEERLGLKIQVDKDLEHYKIPTLSIQLLVENAIKHGIDRLIKGGIVMLDIVKKQDHIHIRVKNPGSLSREKHHGVGLKNLKERLYIQYRSDASFDLKALDENTVEAIMILPLETYENI
ncbi:sensor histidine kinase [Spongiimicrobium salis]|uniref:sensor histidine kinase n=1 Tax=Spongiimicrobium salis TaxID=1667022 RepID=UPI00374C8D63